MGWLDCLRSDDWVKGWEETELDEGKFIEKLRVKEPVFIGKVASFVAGSVTLEDGTQHPLLQSIAQRVLASEIPTERQMKAFGSVFDTLMKKKTLGIALKVETEEDKRERELASTKLIAIASKNIRLFTPKTREIIKSMSDFHMARGYLTIKQMEFLKRMVEQLPSSVLSEKDDYEGDELTDGMGFEGTDA